MEIQYLLFLKVVICVASMELGGSYKPDGGRVESGNLNARADYISM